MSTYKGNAGHLMQHWTLCELLDIAGKKDTPGLNFIDAHAMAPLARDRDPNPGYNARFDGARAGLPGQSVYEQAWHNLDPNGEGYPNSAAFVEEVWEGQVSMLLCEKDESTVTDLKASLPRKPRTNAARFAWGGRKSSHTAIYLQQRRQQPARCRQSLGRRDSSKGWLHTSCGGEAQRGHDVVGLCAQRLVVG